MTESTPSLSLSLSDVALLAGVQRPVVSMWRTRSEHTATPFPAPMSTGRRDRERFTAEQIVDWLEATGRGNNPQARDDVAAFASLDGASIGDPAVFCALTALLCLKVQSGSDLGGMSQAQLLDLADDNDPDDAYLYSELDAAGDRLPELARYAELLASAAYSPQGAFEKLMGERFRAGLHAHAATTIAEPARGLVAKIARALAAGLPTERIRYADDTPGGSDLAVELIRRYGDDADLTVTTAPGESPAARLARRRLRAHDVHQSAPDADDTAHVADTVPGSAGIPTIHIAQFPGPDDPQLTDAQILTAVDDIALQLTGRDRAVIIAPSSALADGTRSPQIDRPRDDVLRTGRVLTIVRLPKGLIPSKSRLGLALWVLGPIRREAPAERRIMVADLINLRLTADVADDLVTDIVAWVDGVAPDAHAFRFTEPALTRVLLTTTRSLVEARPSRRIAPRPDAIGLIARIDAAAQALDNADVTRPLERQAMVTATQPAAPGVTTIDAAIRAGHLKAIPGNRIGPSELAGGGAGVIGPDELTGARPLGSRTVDRLGFTAHHPSGRFTEPGDVVFCASPRPAAMVDHDGGSAVVFPARTLRVSDADPGGLIPGIVAADINGAPAGARAWRLWPIRRAPRDQRAPLQAQLDALRWERLAMLQRLAQLDELTELITDGVTSGVLALTDADGHTEGNS